MRRLLLEYGVVLAGAVAALALLFGHFVIGAPLAVNLFVGFALFAGLALIASSWMDLRIASQARALGMNGIDEKIRQGLARVAAIRQLVPAGADKSVRDRVGRIADLAQRIFDNFKDDPSDKAKASRFLLYLDRILPLIERYARLQSTPEGRKMLQESGDDQEFRELLETAEQGFAQGLQNYLENDVVELRTFARVLKKMMHVAEIGK